MKLQRSCSNDLGTDLLGENQHLIIACTSVLRVLFSGECMLCVSLFCAVWIVVWISLMILMFPQGLWCPVYHVSFGAPGQSHLLWMLPDTCGLWVSWPVAIQNVLVDANMWWVQSVVMMLVWGTTTHLSIASKFQKLNFSHHHGSHLGSKLCEFYMGIWSGPCTGLG